MCIVYQMLVPDVLVSGTLPLNSAMNIGVDLVLDTTLVGSVIRQHHTHTRYPSL